ncbi:MAG: DHH family phosphoesterase [Anaerolineaceae bacterium]|nr:DHH family phosphoesterase [Anaerolineaceae bacterium]
MATPTYVIGHVNPDADSIASAMGYAWLLRERDGRDTVAARAGAINRQTSWALRYLGLETPVLLTDASPRFESVYRRLDTTTLDRPLRDAWGIASRTGGVAPILTKEGLPYGIITGGSLFSFLSKLVGPHHQNQEMKVSEILDLPCDRAVETSIPKFQASTRIRDVINRILRGEEDVFWVVDDQDRYLGVCRQRDLLNPPRLKLILVDHNEAHQSLGSLEEAELLEILDHHRLGNPSTHTPIRFTVDVVGSTSTLVSERVEDAGLSAPPNLAGIMLAGLLSDTLILASPTTTDRDRAAAERLARWAFVPRTVLNGETIRSFGEKVLSAGAGLGVRMPQEVVGSDLKVYSAGGFEFAISQAEVSDLHELTEHLNSLTIALDEVRESKGLDFAALMVTDVVRGSSRILLDNPPAVLQELPYPPLPDGTLQAEGLVSRKKQLLPVVLGLLED